MKINDLTSINELLEGYTGDSVEIEGLTIKDNCPELIFIINKIRAKSATEIIINTEENINNSPMKLMALKQYPNLIIRNSDQDFKLS